MLTKRRKTSIYIGSKPYLSIGYFSGEHFRLFELVLFEEVYGYSLVFLRLHIGKAGIEIGWERDLPDL